MEKGNKTHLDREGCACGCVLSGLLLFLGVAGELEGRGSKVKKWSIFFMWETGI